MLNRFEKRLLKTIYDMSVKNGSCLVSKNDLRKLVSDKREIDFAFLEKNMKSLELEDYFDIVYSDRKGEEMYCITLHAKGRAFSREIEQNKRYFRFKLLLAIGSAFVTFIVGRILYLIFS